MSIDMYVGSSQRQAASIQRMVQQQLEAYGQMEKAIGQFVVNSHMLTGAAYDSAKNHYSSVLLPLLKGGKLYSEAVSKAVQKLPNDYIAKVDSGDLKESELEKKIVQLESQIKVKREQQAHLRSLSLQLPSEERGRYSSSQSSLNGSIETLERTKNKLKEKLQKLREFNISSVTIFAGLAGLESNIAKGSKLATSQWNGSVFVSPSKEQMTWADEINKGWDSYLKENAKNLLNQQIKDILNSSDTDAVKTAKLVKAYEDYLFIKNKEEFDVYNEARKKYGDKWFENTTEMKDIRKGIEDELSQYLQQSNIDIKLLVRELGDDILVVNGQDKFSPLDYLYFASIVDTGAPLDLKSRPYDDSYDFSLWARDWTGDMGGDYLGNYLFGYFGQGYLFFDGPVLKFGAGAAQGWSDKDAGKWLNSMIDGNWGDNTGDTQSIEDGIRDYKKRQVK